MCEGSYERLELGSVSQSKGTDPRSTFASDFDETIYPSFKLLHK
jgi:hypothetical protein